MNKDDTVDKLLEKINGENSMEDIVAAFNEVVKLNCEEIERSLTIYGNEVAAHKKKIDTVVAENNALLGAYLEKINVAMMKSGEDTQSISMSHIRHMRKEIEKINPEPFKPEINVLIGKGLLPFKNDYKPSEEILIEG